MLRSMQKLPLPNNAAFATGGYLWFGNGKVRSLTEAQAVKIIETEGVTPQRDKASGALYFTYSDKNGENVVWYADGDTLKYWSDLAAYKGVNAISLWRLGGNTSLQQVFE